MPTNFPNVIAERLRLWRQGRDAYVHRMLTLLFLGRSPDPWNLPCRLSDNGARFLSLLDEVLFGEEWETPEEFYWEYKLPKRPEDKENGWPDFAALWTDRVLMLELRTEVGSHRDAHVDWYLQLGAHNYGGRAIDLVYITPETTAGKSAVLPDLARFRNCSWAELAKVIEVAWSKTTGREAANALVFAHYLEGIGKVNDAPLPLPPLGTKTRKKQLQGDALGPVVESLDDPTWEQVVETLYSVAEDGEERALELGVAAYESAKELRRRIRGDIDVSDDLRDAAHDIEMWIWHERLGGEALSEAGLESGCEIRVSKRAEARHPGKSEPC
jgi:hypothetical protein